MTASRLCFLFTGSKDNFQCIYCHCVYPYTGYLYQRVERISRSLCNALLLLICTWYRYAHAQTSCQEPSLPIGATSSCETSTIICGPNSFIVIHNITYERQQCTGLQRDNCCCDVAGGRGNGGGKEGETGEEEEEEEEDMCKVDDEDFQGEYFKELTSDCIGVKECQVTNPGVLQPPLCATFTLPKPKTQKISYGCIRNPVSLCSSMTVQRDSGVVYLFYDRTITDNPIDSCSCTVASTDRGRLNVSWVFGSYQEDCSNTHLEISAGTKSRSWKCMNEDNEEKNFNGLHFSKIYGQHLNVSLQRLYDDTPLKAPGRIWIAVEGVGNVYIVCNGGDDQKSGAPVTDRVTGPDGDVNTGSDKTTLVVVVACISALFVLAILLAGFLIWRRLTRSKVSEHHVSYTHATREEDPDYAAISRQGSTYATINDFHIDAGDYSRISVKSNEYNKANLNAKEVVLHPNYSRLQAKNSYSRIKETQNKQAIDSTDYNHTLSTSSVDDYNRTTDIGASAKASFPDYHHIEVKSNTTGDTLNGNIEESKGTTDDNSSANHTYDVLEKGSAGQEVSTENPERTTQSSHLNGGRGKEGTSTGTDSNESNNVTVIAINKNNQPVPDLPPRENNELTNSGYETAVISQNRSDVRSTENTKTSGNGYQTAKQLNNQVLLPTKVVATDKTLDGNEIAPVTNNKVILLTKAVTGKTSDGYEDAVVSHNQTELPTEDDRYINNPDGYETAVVTNNIVELQSATNLENSDGYETAALSNNSVEQQSTANPETKSDGYETAVLSNNSVKLQSTTNPETKSDAYDSVEELMTCTQGIVSSFSEDWYRNTYDKWVMRHEKCVQLNGGYDEKE